MTDLIGIVIRLGLIVVALGSVTVALGLFVVALSPPVTLDTPGDVAVWDRCLTSLERKMVYQFRIDPRPWRRVKP